MGAERMAPGKSSATEVASRSRVNADSTYATPGKTTQTQRLYGPGTQTGIAGVDNAGKGGGQTARGENFLTDQQRPYLVAEYIGRVNAAHTAYMAALIDLRVERFVQKEEEFPIVAALLFAAGGKAAETVLRGAFALLRRGGEAAHQLAEAGITTIASHEADNPMMGLSEQSVEFLISQAADQAKEKLKAPAVKALGAEQETDKGAALSFIDYMRDASMTLFQRFREEPIGRASDAQLLALFASFEASRHTPTLYRVGCDAYLKKYMASHAKEIGHRQEFGVKDGRMNESRVETKIANIKMGDTSRLGYVKTERNTADGEQVPSGAGLDAPDHAVGMDDEETPEFLGWVEPELEDVAKATHDARWLQTPATYTMNLPSMTLSKGTP